MPVTDRRTFLADAGFSLLAVPLGAAAQQAAKLPRIGMLRPGSADQVMQ